MKKIEMKNGDKYGDLTVIGEVKRGRKRREVICQCTCYNLTITTVDSLRCGKTQSCGCRRSDFAKTKLIDISGKTFKNIQVISISEKRQRNRVTYFCKCLLCYNFMLVTGYLITRNQVKSCGCLVHKYNRDKDLIGKVFGHLHVLERTDSYYNIRSTQVRYLCYCDRCGSISKIRGTHIRRGIKSCPCISRNLDLSEEDREENQLRHLFRVFRQEIYKRDNFICSKCGQRGYQLNAHHIYNWHSHKDLRLTEINLLTMCKSCHEDFHNLYGKKFNDLYQLEEYLGKQLDIRDELLSIVGV